MDDTSIEGWLKERRGKRAYDHLDVTTSGVNIILGDFGSFIWNPCRVFCPKDSSSELFSVEHFAWTLKVCCVDY